MTQQEQKLDLMHRGFTIVENIIDQPPNGKIVQVVIAKRDTDMLVVNGQPGLYFDAYLNMDFFMNTLRESALAVETFISKRHAKNISVCEHEKVTLDGGLIGCLHCMAKLGTHVDTKGGFNVTLNNN